MELTEWNSFGKFTDPKTNFVHSIGEGYIQVYDPQSYTFKQLISLPLANNMKSETANAFPAIRNSRSSILFIPYFDDQFSKQLYEISTDFHQIKVVCPAPACDFFCYARLAPGKILALDRTTKRYFVFAGEKFDPLEQNLFPNHANVAMAGFCGKICIFDENSEDIAIIQEQAEIVSKVIKSNRPACKKWFVDAVYLNLVFLSCESEEAAYYCIFDIIEEKVIAQSTENIEELHFPYINEKGLLMHQGKQFEIDTVLKEVFKLDFTTLMQQTKEALSSFDNGLADYERDIYKQFGLIDYKSEMQINLISVIEAQMRQIENDLIQEICTMKGDFEKRISVLEMKIDKLEKK